ncbi:calnexin [Folsomia candida]|uniref:Calnexin n=1 Tax=Folsomia candida TaxID=158441 RepID=A0A226E8A4_FOLCA|nr:calnexin [Folsomia candida]OXA53227.1 Calnexin [Folsomia candida]
MTGPSWRLLRLLLLVSLVIGAVMAKRERKDKVKVDDDLTGSDDADTVVASRGDDEFDIIYESPTPIGDYHFAEHFDDVEAAKKRWIMSKAQKEEQDNVFKYEGQWDFEFPLNRMFPTDKALILKSKAKLHAISAKLDKPFDFTDKPLIVQYEVNFQNGMDCGGAYIKLISNSKNMGLPTFNDKTPYTIMFGPDKCGSDMKIHFIFRHKNPINGTFSEKHSKRPSNRVEESYGDKKPHLYRLKLTPDNKFEVFVDDRLINSGSLLDDMEPKVNPPMEIEDPNQVKPADWDEREKIPDPTAEKPEDWDEDAPMKIPDPNANPPSGWLIEEPEMVPDPTAIQPQDWDDSMDGSWEAPLITNPKCATAPGCGSWSPPQIDNPEFKGKWKPPMISNPNYKGKWIPAKIPNPDYFEDKEPFKMTSIGAVGLELWTMTDQVLFDNFIISNDQSVVDDWTSKTWELKRRVLEKDNEGVFRRTLNYTNAHPWLWAVYVLVIALPIVLIFTFCCGSSQDKKSETYKKNDELSPDDDDAAVAGASTSVPTSAKSKESSGARQRGHQVSKDDLEDSVPSRSTKKQPEPEPEPQVDDDETETETDSEEVEEERPPTPEPEPEPIITKRRGKGRPRKE